MALRQACISVLLLCATALCGVLLAKDKDEAQSTLEIAVYDDTHLESPVLQAAGIEMTRIFHSAGINVVWTTCSPGRERCSIDPAKTLVIVLRILPHARVSSSLVFGQAFVGDDGFGRYADIFLDHIEGLHRSYGTDIPRLLGAISAHEAGHLLLGSRAHSVAGIMTPIWESDELSQVERGMLLFAPQQASRMQKRLRAYQIETCSVPSTAPGTKLALSAQHQGLRDGR